MTSAAAASSAFALHLPLADRIAGNYAKRMPRHVLLDDVKAAARAGLWQSALKYGHLPHSEFARVARTRIAGAIADELRAEDWLTRRGREKAEELELREVRLDHDTSLPLPMELTATPDPEAEIDGSLAEQSSRVERALGCLSERQRAVVVETMRGSSQAQIAAVLRVSDAAANQLLKRGIDRLRAAVETMPRVPPKRARRRRAPQPTDGINLKATVTEFERALIVEALRLTNWNKTRAARALGVNRTALIMMVHRHHISQEAAP